MDIKATIIVKGVAAENVADMLEAVTAHAQAAVTALTANEDLSVHAKVETLAFVNA